MSALKRSGHILSLLLIISWAAPVQAEDSDWGRANEEYSKKNWSGARSFLLKYLKDNATAYQAHYLIANCYLQLGDKANAKRSYAMALANRPDATTKERCLRAIERISQILTAPQSPSSSSSSSSSSSAASGLDKPHASTPSGKEMRIKQLEVDIENIQKASDSETAKIRQEAKTAIENYTESNGRWWRDRETGERHFGLSKQWEQELQAPYSARIDKIIQDTEARIAGKRKEIEDLSK